MAGALIDVGSSRQGGERIAELLAEPSQRPQPHLAPPGMFKVRLTSIAF